MSDPSLLDWQDGQPVSRLYGDVFFSRTSGIEETRHVFLGQNRLAERWRDLPSGTNFIIGESGFGTGLNFLCAWQLWQECAPPEAWLHFFSIEKHPLNKTELGAALALWPQLASMRDELLAQYDDALAAGWHRFVFASSRVTLTLAVEDIAIALTQLDIEADAWFLDGFAPSRNPDMWSIDVLQQVARQTKLGGSFATYSAAGEVRRGLQSAGFDVERVAGYGSKREMLRGVLTRSLAKNPDKPWFQRPALRVKKRAIVIGGGLAGTSAAASLALRGWQVALVERHPMLAAEASGNDQGILYARLSGHPTPLRALVVSGYAYSNRLLKLHQMAPNDYSQCGVLQLAFNEEEAERQTQLRAQGFPAVFFRSVDTEEARALCGVDVKQPGLWFPGGGWAHPPALCAALANRPGIAVYVHTEALELRKEADEWQVSAEGRPVARAPVVILAGARDSTRFEQSAYLPLTSIRGQITSLPQNSETKNLRAVICGEGYIAPARAGLHTLGATHTFRDLSTEVRTEEHEKNLAMLQALAPSLASGLPNRYEGRAAIRSSTPDYLPLVGPLVDANAFRSIYAALGRDATRMIDAPPPWQEGLYVSTAHGSRGLITAPLAGEILAAYLNDEPAPLAKGVMEALHPSRFLLRDLIRRKV